MNCPNLPIVCIPRESKELIKVTVVRGSTTITDYQLTFVPLSARPVTGWADPTTVGSDQGYLLPGTHDAPASYILWAQVDTGQEVAVIPIQRVDLT